MRGRGDERCCVLVAGGSAAWEAQALPALEADGIVVLKRCVDVPDLLASARSRQADVALVAADLPGLDADAVMSLLRDEVRAVAMASLRKMFGEAVVEPDGMLFPRWLSDPWSRGGYSYPGVGSAPADRADHARPLGQRVFFAGEATEPVEYGTVHAALWSGEQAAEGIWRAVCGVEAGRRMRPWSGARLGAP